MPNQKPNNQDNKKSKKFLLKPAFSMLELTLAIVIIASLMTIALPRIWAGKDDATLVLARSQIAAINAGIAQYYASTALSSQPHYPELKSEFGRVFTDVVSGGLAPFNGSYGWSQLENNKFKYTLGNESATFTYDRTNGSFDCGDRQGLCGELMR